MKRAIVFVFALISSVVLASAEYLPGRSVNTAGEATVYVMPDEAEISLAVVSSKAKLDDAKTDNDAAAGLVVAAIKALGVDAKMISTSDVTVQIDYMNGGSGRDISGYTVRRSYVIKLTDIKLVSKVIDTGLNNGVNELDGVSFTSTQLRKYRDQARKMAAKAAREKAADLAEELGAAIGPVRTINENSGVWGNYWNGYGGRRFGSSSNAFQNASVAEGNAAGGDEDSTTPPGQIAIHASVTATFDLKDAPAAKP